jgi:hypothetical protein
MGAQATLVIFSILFFSVHTFREGLSKPLVLTYGKDKNYHMEISTIKENSIPKEIEFKGCFPAGTWLGFGLGGILMTTTELVFMMGP